jgi:hypothetical protein
LRSPVDAQARYWPDGYRTRSDMALPSLAFKAAAFSRQIKCFIKMGMPVGGAGSR